MNESEVFTVDERAQVLERVLAIAELDPRIIAGAIVGSLATGEAAMTEADRWSDLDLTFAVADTEQSLHQVPAVLDRISDALATEFGAVRLFDLPSDGVLYRVLLLRGVLQVDISAAPQAKFGARGPKFRLLFGQQMP